MEKQFFNINTTKNVSGNMFGKEFKVEKETFKVRGEKKVWKLTINGEVVDRVRTKRAAITKLNVLLTKIENEQRLCPKCKFEHAQKPGEVCDSCKISQEIHEERQQEIISLLEKIETVPRIRLEKEKEDLLENKGLIENYFGVLSLTASGKKMLETKKETQQPKEETKTSLINGFEHEHHTKIDSLQREDYEVEGKDFLECLQTLEPSGDGWKRVILTQDDSKHFIIRKVYDKESGGKDHKLVCEHTGELSYTRKSPLCPLEKFDGDLSEKTTALFSSDMWEPVTVDKYEVREEWLPYWVTPEQYCKSTSLQVSLKYLFGFCAALKYDYKQLSEKWSRKLIEMSCFEKYTCISILKVKKFRSKFKKSLREQLEKWLNAESNAYDSPFSSKQWDYAAPYGATWKSKNLSTSLYYQR